ncbi:hypothetical protein OM076_05885 [Solirubrobacter ginsenosidimutans]|uniref:Uncharacterized protein n=1 Tax=Solirubrobacter ginsenosidimutans TaxID=490573 RepID=A0A9X3MRA4_9ACTN|nr:hypothetical protein [Solirubrobacter ginsenosidimutans]MDA0159783.1 hypothetical protein [Solirubrobacter ginsenosidimutans]
MLLRGVGVFAAVALLGAVAGQVATAGDDSTVERTVQVGATTLRLTGDWRMVDATTLANGPARMHVVLDPSLRAEGGSPARLGGYRGWSSGSGTVLPTTRGMLRVSCDPRPCQRAVRSVSVTGAAILAPAPGLALRLRAPAVLATLDATRASARTALAHAAAPSPATRELAHRLAVAHRTALEALRPLANVAGAASASAAGASTAGTADTAAAGTAGGGLVTALERSEGAYDQLAGATSARAFNAARDEVVATDRAVEAAVAGLARGGAPAVQAPRVPAAAPAGGGASLLTLLLVLATALLVSALAPASLRRLRARRTACDIAKPCVVARRQRTPIAPPPTYGRWNEAPRGPDAAPEDGARTPTTAWSSTA